METKTLYAISRAQSEVLLDEVYIKGDAGEKNMQNLLSFRTYIKDDCSFPALEYAWNRLLLNNDALRIRIASRGKKRFSAYSEKQYIKPYEKETLEKVTVSGKSGLDHFCDLETKHPVIVKREAPLYRATLVDCGGGSGGLVVCFHHLICDGYSLQLMFRQLEKSYFAFLNGESDGIKTGSITEHFAREESYIKSDAFKDDCQFWKSEYRKQKHYTIPAGKPSKCTDAASEELALTPHTYELLTRFCSENQCSMPSVLLSATAITVYRLTGKKNFSLFNLIHGRDTFKLKRTVGCMVRTVPVMFNIDLNKSFSCAAKDEYKHYLETLSHSRLPFSRHVLYSYFKSLKNGFNFYHNWFLFSAMEFGTLSANSKIGLQLVKKYMQSNIFYCAVYDMPEEKTVCLELVYQTGKYSSEKIKAAATAFNETLSLLLSAPDKKMSEVFPA